MHKKYLPHNNSAINKIWIILIFILIFVTMTGARALAHKVNIYAYVEGDTVYTESYFSDGKKCVNSKITVFNSSGNQLLEGITNGEGEFFFKIPDKTDLRIVLNAGTGHRSEYIITASEFRDYPEGKTGTSKEVQGENSLKEVGREKEISFPGGGIDDLEAIQSVVETALDRKLRPIIKSLKKIEQSLQRPSLTEVLGGIGYIFGIVGIVIYLRNRKK